MERRIVAWCRTNASARRLATIPGVGPITATALAATITDPTLFRSGRQLAAWLGLVPRQHSTGGKASSVGSPKWATGICASSRRRHDSGDPIGAAHQGAAFAWVNALLERRPARLVSVALANKTARIVWAILLRGEIYRAPVTEAAA